VSRPGPELAATIGRIADDGFATIPGVLDDDAVAQALRALDDVFEQERDIAATREWLTDEYLVSYALPIKHPAFLELVAHPTLTAIARGVLGADCLLAAFNGLSMVPGGRAQPLHADHPEPAPGTCLYLHLVCALDPFDAANGATRVVAGTHRRAVAPDRTAAHEAEAEVVEMPAGSVLAFDGSLLHAGSANRTDQPRRALHVFFCRRWVRPHWDFPAMVPPDVAAGLDDERRELLGFTARPARFDLDRSTIAWH
jgi:ectoine hydroxylase-related dioxygenase (phytanoyl-CoA dioxygenase family)